MHPTPHRTRVIITSVAAVHTVIGAAAAAVNRWRRCKTIERKAGPLVCHDELHARLRGPEFDAEPLMAHGPEVS